jgi:predicted LPLAT superfamily acyltransferase
MSVKQRGSAWSIKLVYNLYRLFGYKFIYYLMYPVSYFYYLKAGNVKKALKIYYEQIGVEFSKKIHHEHLRHFAICMCDRFISLIDPQSYKYEIEGRENLESDLKKGGILLLSHYGGWASAANCFGYLGLKMNIVMQEVLMQGIKDIEESIKSEKTSHLHVIDTAKGGIAVTLEIAKALSQNELVAMMADRATSKKNTKEIDFFKKNAKFNKNPFEIAYKTDKPLFALFISYLSPQNYKIDYIKIQMNIEKSINREVERCMEMYAQRFEENIKIYPQGWFNLYDFWEK